MCNMSPLRSTSLILALILSISVSALAIEDDGHRLTEMTIQSLGFDRVAGSPIVLLAAKDGGDIVIPIWIGLCEARSIELGQSNAITPRPLTYDLVAAMVRTLQAKVERVVIVDVRDEVYYAQVELSVGGKVTKIDARPSDAIALATRMGAPIFARQTVIDRSNVFRGKKKERGT